MTETFPPTGHTYRVAGMTCLRCVKSVSEELSRLDGVTEVDVNLEVGVVRIFGESLPTDDHVAAVLEEIGYSVVA